MPLFGSRNQSERSAKILTAVVYIAVHFAAFLWAVGFWKPLGALWRPFPGGLWDYFHLALPPAAQVALLAPLVSLAIFGVLHWCDASRYEEYRSNRLSPDKLIWGLESRKNENNAHAADYASSAISRLSLHSALAAGVIWAILKAAVPGSVTVVSFAAGMLGLSIIWGMVSVLCYAHAGRWTVVDSKNPAREERLQTKRELLGKAALRDQQAWYMLTTGLLWAIAVVSPPLSILASLLYGLLLWRYYFRWDTDPIKKVEDSPPDSASARDVQASIDAFSRAQSDFLAKVKARLDALETAERQREARIAKLEQDAKPPKPAAG